MDTYEHKNLTNYFQIIAIAKNSGKIKGQLLALGALGAITGRWLPLKTIGQLWLTISTLSPARSIQRRAH